MGAGPMLGAKGAMPGFVDILPYGARWKGIGAIISLLLEGTFAEGEGATAAAKGEVGLCSLVPSAGVFRIQEGVETGSAWGSLS